jgi:hypothetical protein
MEKLFTIRILSSFYAEYEFENEDIYARESEEEMR